MRILSAIRRAIFSVSFLKVLLFAALLGGLGWTARSFDFSVPAMRAAIEGGGTVRSAAVLAGLYVFCSIAPISARDVLKVLGVLFLGPWVSAAAIWVADVAAAVVSFFLAKWLGREWIERWTGRRMAWINRRLEERGLRNMVILRLLPTPYRHLNFLAGVTRISFSDFFWGTVLGALPRSVLTQLVLWPFVDRIIRGDATGTTLVWVAMGGLAVMMTMMYGIYRLVRALRPGFFRDEDRPAAE
jgi:uncharacterized membrane protein YdjX (TVP38/TMEM64 family)